MNHLRVLGGLLLSGTIRVSGSKNAALPMMATSILAAGPVRLDGVPRLADVDTLAMVLRELGMDVVRTPDGGLLLETVETTPVRARYELVRRMRASFCVLGPLLARRGAAVVSLPGGCNIGPRPVELHLNGLSAPEADLRIEHGNVVARARRLVGATVRLSGPRRPTVTGTANRLLRRRSGHGADHDPGGGRRAGHGQGTSHASVALFALSNPQEHSARDAAMECDTHQFGGIRCVGRLSWSGVRARANQSGERT